MGSLFAMTSGITAEATTAATSNATTVRGLPLSARSDEITATTNEIPTRVAATECKESSTESKVRPYRYGRCDHMATRIIDAAKGRYRNLEGGGEEKESMSIATP